MSTVAEIPAALQTLSVEERAELLAESCGWTDDHWDQQMNADAASDKFNALNNWACVEKRLERGHSCAQV